MEQPYCWGIYDHRYEDFKPGKGMLLNISKEEYDGALDGFCFLLLNPLERIYKQRWMFSKSHIAWENYILYLMASSTRFAAKLAFARQSNMYSPKFSNYLLKLENVVLERLKLGEEMKGKPFNEKEKEWFKVFRGRF